MKYRLSWKKTEHFTFTSVTTEAHQDFDTAKRAAKKCLDLFSISHNSYIEYNDFELVKYEDASKELEQAIKEEKLQRYKG